MIQLLNSLPNGIWATARTVTPLTKEQAIAKLNRGFQSFVGHATFAEVVSVQTGIDIPVNRQQANLQEDIIAALITTPRRLAEGEQWTEQELLSMPIQWVSVKCI